MHAACVQLQCGLHRCMDGCSSTCNSSKKLRQLLPEGSRTQAVSKWTTHCPALAIPPCVSFCSHVSDMLSDLDRPPTGRATCEVYPKPQLPH
jgi:hypothetical protein